MGGINIPSNKHKLKERIITISLERNIQKKQNKAKVKRFVTSRQAQTYCYSIKGTVT